MQQWGGPLTADWHAKQKALQVQIVTRMREFGMVPVLAGFAGHVPAALQAHYPGNYTQSSDWCNFPQPYGSVTLLEPTDALFQTLGAALNKATLEDYGDPTGLETPVVRNPRAPLLSRAATSARPRALEYVQTPPILSPLGYEQFNADMYNEMEPNDSDLTYLCVKCSAPHHFESPHHPGGPRRA